MVGAPSLGGGGTRLRCRGLAPLSTFKEPKAFRAVSRSYVSELTPLFLASVFSFFEIEGFLPFRSLGGTPPPREGEGLLLVGDVKSEAKFNPCGLEIEMNSVSLWLLLEKFLLGLLSSVLPLVVLMVFDDSSKTLRHF